MLNRQFPSPLVVKDGNATQLQRVEFAARDFNEAQLQQFLFDHPLLIPVAELEPVFSGLLPVAAGPVDLVYINALGFITIVETKLWRNPEARRSVVAQIIDYTKEMASWSYQEFEDAIRQAGGLEGSKSLTDLFAEREPDFDEGAFIDQVSRNLRMGRFLLLIVGDGIREDVERMTDFLQRTPQLGFTMGLVELGIFALPGQSSEFFIQPRIIARTREVTRAIVEIREMQAADVRVTIPTEIEATSIRTKSITEQEFFEHLQTEAAPEVADYVRSLLECAPAHQLNIDYGANGPLYRYWEQNTGENYFTFGKISRNGRSHFWGDGFTACQQLGIPEAIWEDYLQGVMALVPGTERLRKQGRWNTVVVKGGGGKGGIPSEPLAENRVQYLELIDRTIARIQAAIKARASEGSIGRRA